MVLSEAWDGVFFMLTQHKDRILILCFLVGSIVPIIFSCPLRKLQIMTLGTMVAEERGMC